MTYNSSFHDRASQAAQAKQKALEKYKSRPPIDEKVAAERAAASQWREEAKAEKAATKKAEAEAKAADDAAKAACSRGYCPALMVTRPEHSCSAPVRVVWKTKQGTFGVTPHIAASWRAPL